MGIFVSLFAGLGTSGASAQEVEPDWISVRHSGMGFSSTAVSTDSESVFANPAGLSRMRNPRSRDGIHEIQFPRMSVVGSERTLGVIGDEVGNLKANPLPAIVADSEPRGNSANGTEIRMFPSIVFGGKSAATWLVGLYADSRNEVLHQQASEDGLFSITRDNTFGGAVGVGGSSRGGTFAYGFSLRPNSRYFGATTDQAIAPQSPPDLATGISSLGRTIGIGVDAGVLFTAADFWLPTIGLVARNLPTGCAADVVHPFAKSAKTICGSKRSGATDQAQIRTLVDPTDIRIGVSMTPRFSVGPDRLNLRLSAEASSITWPQDGVSYGLPDVPLERMLKAGVELFFGHPLMVSPFALRAGIYAGEPTWGASLEVWLVRLEYSSFAKETSFDDGSKVKRRQHMGGLSLRW
jgi:hypothetical protein